MDRRGGAEMEIEAGHWALRSPPREAIRVREPQQGAPSAVRRVRRGGTLGVTCHGRLVAVLAPPALAPGAGSLVAAKGATPAPGGHGPLPGPAVALHPTHGVLDKLRANG